MKEDIFTVAVIQPHILIGKLEKNLETIEILLNSAMKKKKIDFVVLPEYCYGVHELPIEEAQKILDWQSKIAQNLNITLVAGTFSYYKGENLVNACFIYSNDGSLLYEYHKRHPFQFERKRNVKEGNTPPIFSVDGKTYAVVICADLWYPELLRPYNSDIICTFVPTMSVVPNSDYTNYGRWWWHQLAAVRAKENTTPIAISDSARAEYYKGRWISGASTIVKPYHKFSNNESPWKEAQLVLDNGKQGFLIQTFELEKLFMYREYRKESGLLS